MKKKELKEFTITLWDGMNIFLFITTTVTTIIFIILFILSITMKTGTSEQSFVLGMCGVFASLASAFFIAWIMRMYDLIKKREQELKALTLLRPYLQKTLSTINNFFPQLKSFVTINSDDTVQYPHEVVYYTDPSKDDGNRSFIDFNLAFREAYSQLNDNLNDCLSAPILFQCNEKIVNLLTGLKLNGLTQNLFEIYKASSEPFFTNTSFKSVHQNYTDFISCYETLAKAAMQKTVGSLKELSPDEKQTYILEIDTIKKQIPVNHSGRIYKGNIRIQ